VPFKKGLKTVKRGKENGNILTQDRGMTRQARAASGPSATKVRKKKGKKKHYKTFDQRNVEQRRKGCVHRGEERGVVGGIASERKGCARLEEGAGRKEG